MMRFYYISLFSAAAYAVAACVAIVLLSLLWTKLLKLKVSNPVYWILVAAILVGPWLEELSIAYNFDRLCRNDAGVFVNKTVEVDGFYIETGGAPLDLVRTGTYRFIESRSEAGYSRLSLGDNALLETAIDRFRKTKPGRDPFGQDSIRVDIDERTEALVFPKRKDVWRITKLDRPTARYHYKKLSNHAPVSHQVKKFEDVVVDSESGEVLGRYTNYYRGPYWFHISLGYETIPCEETQAATRKYGSLIYPLVLRPSK